ncbi:hypothetical protein C7M84_001490 [Penaeus vannamei]|uniref:Uncharacterized protein n=1 Tax=Penaeus vannamei TaxID=6689 RepID=A0A3R7QI99_PENVA|nr:hypothetical protein C7M84_001490 [Penaeus vannamei]
MPARPIVTNIVLSGVQFFLFSSISFLLPSFLSPSIFLSLSPSFLLHFFLLHLLPSSFSFPFIPPPFLLFLFSPPPSLSPSFPPFLFLLPPSLLSSSFLLLPISQPSIAFFLSSSFLYLRLSSYLSLSSTSPFYAPHPSTSPSFRLLFLLPTFLSFAFSCSSLSPFVPLFLQTTLIRPYYPLPPFYPPFSFHFSLFPPSPSPLCLSPSRFPSSFKLISSPFSPFYLPFSFFHPSFSPSPSLSPSRFPLLQTHIIPFPPFLSHILILPSFSFSFSSLSFIISSSPPPSNSYHPLFPLLSSILLLPSSHLLLLLPLSHHLVSPPPSNSYHPPFYPPSSLFPPSPFPPSLSPSRFPSSFKLISPPPPLLLPSLSLAPSTTASMDLPPSARPKCYLHNFPVKNHLSRVPDPVLSFCFTCRPHLDPSTFKAPLTPTAERIYPNPTAGRPPSFPWPRLLPESSLLSLHSLPTTSSPANCADTVCFIPPRVWLVAARPRGPEGRYQMPTQSVRPAAVALQGETDSFRALEIAVEMNPTCLPLSPVLMQAPGLATTRAEAESQQNAPELNAKLLNETRDAGGRRVNAPPTGLPTPDPNLEVTPNLAFENEADTAKSLRPLHACICVILRLVERLTPGIHQSGHPVHPTHLRTKKGLERLVAIQNTDREFLASPVSHRDVRAALTTVMADRSNGPFLRLMLHGSKDAREEMSVKIVGQWAWAGWASHKEEQGGVVGWAGWRRKFPSPGPPLPTADPLPTHAIISVLLN